MEVIVFEQTGKVNNVYGVIKSNANKINRETTKEEIKELHEQNEKAILDYFRYDQEKSIVGVQPNPSKETGSIEFYYTPTLIKQEIAKNLPYKLTETVTIIDSFACQGTRFGLQPLVVFVEVCQSNCGNNRIWANIYYAADSEIPCSIIKVNRYWV